MARFFPRNVRAVLPVAALLIMAAGPAVPASAQSMTSGAGTSVSGGAVTTPGSTTGVGSSGTMTMPGTTGGSSTVNGSTSTYTTGNPGSVSTGFTPMTNGSTTAPDSMTTGTSGSTMTNGAVGTTGTAGSNGAVGTTGTAGTTGMAGANGAVGTTGTAGTNGAVSSYGTMGTTGSINGATNGTNPATMNAAASGTLGTDMGMGAAGSYPYGVYPGTNLPIVMVTPGATAADIYTNSGLMGAPSMMTGQVVNIAGGPSILTPGQTAAAGSASTSSMASASPMASGAGLSGSLAATIPLTVDSPAMNETFFNGDVLDIGGWTVGAHVEIFLDGPSGQGLDLGSAAVGAPRPDVAQTTGDPTLANSGFNMIWTPQELSQGSHSLYVYSWINGAVALDIVPMTDQGDPPMLPWVPIG